MANRNALMFGLLIFMLAILTSCGIKEIRDAKWAENEAENFPDSEIAYLNQYAWKGFLFNESKFNLEYIDGKRVPLFLQWHEKILPGKHTLGIHVMWGNICPPAFLDTVCFNACYSGFVLIAEAGRKYSYGIERTKDEINVLLSDETGAVVAKGRCEELSGILRNNTVIERIHERIERESKLPESDDK